MGVVYLFVLFAVFLFLGSLVQITGSAVSQAYEVIRGTVDESSASVNAFFDYAFKQLQWDGNFVSMIVNAVRTHWLSNTIRGFFETLSGTSGDFSGQISVIMDEFMTNLRIIASVAITLCVAGVIAANFLTRYMVRRRTAKRGLKKFIIARTVVPVVESIFVSGSVAVLAALRYYGILVVVALLVLSGAFSLTSSWIIHKKGDIKMKDVVTFKNILRNGAAACVILLIDVVIAVALLFVSPLLAALVAVPVVLYSLNIIGVNTDSFVCEMIASRERQSAAAEAEGAAEGAAEAAAETAAGADTSEKAPPAQRSSRRPRKNK